MVDGRWSWSYRPGDFLNHVQRVRHHLDSSGHTWLVSDHVPENTMVTQNSCGLKKGLQ